MTSPLQGGDPRFESGKAQIAAYFLTTMTKDNVNNSKIKTGIYGFDDLTLGGLPEKRCALVKGSIGTGKTVFSIEYIYRGISVFNENGIYITFEESPDQIKKNSMSFGWDLQKLEDEGKLKIIDARDVWITSIEDESTASGLGHLLNQIKKEAGRINAKRIAIDTMYGMFVESKFVILLRRELHKILNALNGMECTSILTMGNINTVPGVVDYSQLLETLVDCVIILREKEDGIYPGREIKILKMRGNDYIAGAQPMIITSNGIAVFPLMPDLYDMPAKDAGRKESPYIESPKVISSLTKKIPRGYNILIAGETGTNAGNIARQMLYDGLIKGESCMLVNTHESSYFVKEFMKNFGMDVEKYLKNNKMFFFDDYVKSGSDERIINESFNNPLILGYLMDRWLMDNKPENFRWAINSITTMFAVNDEPGQSSANIQRFLYDRVRKTRRFMGIGVYTINKDAHQPNLINMIENMMDLVIELKLVEEKGVQHSYIRILKARGTKANTSWHQYNIAEGKGIILADDIYSALKSV